MSASGLRRRLTVALATVATVTLVAALPSVASHAAAKPLPNRFDLQLLALNDFHGNLEPPSGSSGRIGVLTGTFPNQVCVAPTCYLAGGAAFLAGKLKELRAQAAAAGKPSLTVAAGDLIGASPLISAAFHDEPTIEAMNLAGLQVASVGNHEFDEGYRELQRMDAGGCLADGPTGRDNQNSCPDEAHPFTGADFAYLAANVKETATGQTILPATSIKTVNGVKVGFIGMTLEGTPQIVSQAGIAGLEFGDEVATANSLVPQLKKQGAKAIVVLLHEGGLPSDPSQYNACPGISGPIVDIAHALSTDIDAIISGHTHQGYNCQLPDPAGNPRLVTSASSFGRLVTEVTLTINTQSGDVMRATSNATNHIVTRTGGDSAMAALVAKYKEMVRPIESKVIGQVATKAPITKTNDASGESQLGNLIADAQVTDPTVVRNGVVPQIAFMNPGGIRTDLVVDSTSGDVTYGSAFAVQPFNNYVVSMDMTGAEIETLLEQQFIGFNASPNNKVLSVSNGFTYTWKASGTDRIDPATIKLNGVPLDPGTTYRVVANSFLSDGGDGFGAFAGARNKLIGGLDIDSFANYLAAHSPYAPVATDRIPVG
jgi:5'-nucleotidase